MTLVDFDLVASGFILCYIMLNTKWSHLNSTQIIILSFALVTFTMVWKYFEFPHLFFIDFLTPNLAGLPDPVLWVLQCTNFGIAGYFSEYISLVNFND